MNNILRKLISRYYFSFPKNLVYMLQASEYDLGEFFAWYWRTNDFRTVSKRKSLVKTPKAMVLLILSWVILLSIYFSSLFFAIITAHIWYLIAGLVFGPVVLPYILVLVLLVMALLQIPLEFVIINKAKKRLLKNRALRIAVAGSYGKTTMREILKTVLTEGKKVATVPSNYNTPLGISKFILSLNGDEDILVFEMGEYYPGDIRKLCRLVNPDIGVITGVNEAHLKKFKSLENTAKTIFELADWLGGKPLYVNGEDLIVKNFLKNTSRNQEHYSFFSRNGLGKLVVSNAKTSLIGTSFDLTHGSENKVFSSRLLGLHQIGPLLVAIDVALKLGMTMEKVIAGVGKTKPFEHRMEPKTDSAGVVTIDDSYNGNPTGVKAVIDFLASIKGHRRLYVTPGLVEMGSRSEEIHREIGRELSNVGIEKVLLIRNSVTPYIYNGLIDSGYSGEVIWFDDALKAFASLPNMTVSGDVVVLQNDWPDQYV
ncbi:MAG: UDP-N-acetylmuramoyl-tripeptide--D-alanyl-D-alanine ligase [Candidatus Doudnabacteria bacterium Gr01-1014_77]|uniref:UDP-N-acetylmuramoyl-tripeptide--D-alanyl-D-alanine ligase n=1 Tax=Candidatus Doudnabacteria bacterium Gr01-1014_77 TaxID=2017133 RepID=A0A554JDJ1_9BACT|nr:MAG: UDP-N-acetylmuramoyl-tripeptide--D-alanyl-D-alanine ligase [Candidatus Doudnabacteria bacterium Gr01-1014_77]